VFGLAQWYYFTFGSRNQAVYMESILRDKGYRVELRPTPSKLGKSCNTSLVALGEPEEIDRIRDELLAHRMLAKGIYKEIRSGYFKDYIKVY
jgi:hypothetical protein